MIEDTGIIIGHGMGGGNEWDAKRMAQNVAMEKVKDETQEMAQYVAKKVTNETQKMAQYVAQVEK